MQSRVIGQTSDVESFQSVERLEPSLVELVESFLLASSRAAATSIPPSVPRSTRVETVTGGKR